MRALLLGACAIALLMLAPAALAKVHVVETVATGDASAPFAFSPASLTIAAGDTVRWVNTDGAFHTTTSQDGHWDGTLGSSDASFEHTFAEAGTFDYRCNPHASFMTGTITVTAAGGASSAGEESPGLGFLAPLAAIGLVAMRRVS